jgi:transcriptional regulator with XRE-family HTH domain
VRITAVFDPLQLLSAALLARRLALGLTQEAVGLEIGMSQSQYSRIERGEVNVKFRTLVRVARALDASPSELLLGFGGALDVGGRQLQLGDAAGRQRVLGP